MTRLDRFRANKDEFFRSDPHSPLLPEQQARFTALRYFPENPALRFEVALDREAVNHTLVQLPTTTGEQQTFVPAGKLHLTIEGQPVSLVLYRESGRGRYFLPFRDGTTGTETYILGRYLDPQEKPNGTMIVDFNYAYSPYCAYNDRWSCPLPPAENEVAVPIRAGELSFTSGSVEPES
jgi:uncharacterized protein (DUF1684 family)